VIDMPTLHDEPSVAKYLGLRVLTLHRLRRAKEISAVRVGKVWKYTDKFVQDYLEKQTCHAFGSPTNTPSSSVTGPIAITLSGAKAAKRNSALQALQALIPPEPSLAN
jgi:excisionase family DNA binding protein